jgi:hypothetical protein
MSKAAASLIAGLCLALVACGGGARTVTEKRMLEWGPALNLFMGSNFQNANAYPDTLEELPAAVRAALETTDGWGNPILYRKLRIDLYNLISAGPDGELGNDDDIVVENGALYDAAKVYAEWPLRR